MDACCVFSTTTTMKGSAVSLARSGPYGLSCFPMSLSLTERVTKPPRAFCNASLSLFGINIRPESIPLVGLPEQVLLCLTRVPPVAFA